MKSQPSNNHFLLQFETTLGSAQRFGISFMNMLSNHEEDAEVFLQLHV